MFVVDDACPASPATPGEHVGNPPVSRIDVIISVCGKPMQTALALLSLERASGRHIDKIYFIEENTATRGVEGGCHQMVLDALGPKIVHFVPKQWNYCFPIEMDRMGDEDYRHSVRYQYGWEKTDKDFALIIHNDAVFRGDVVGAMLDAIDGHVAAGQIGQCWYCPAAFAGKCTPDTYMDYRPGFRELLDLYVGAKPPPGRQVRAYHLPRMHELFFKQPWPLPECRVNEWCCLVNMRIARRLTMPLGSVVPFGAFINVGKQILDVGCQWFRQMHQRGHTCLNFDIFRYMHHDVPPTGQPTLIDKGRYDDKERQALEMMRHEFGFIE